MLVRIDAVSQEFVVQHRGKEVKRLTIKGLQRSGPIPFDDWVEQLRQEAVSEARRQRQRGRSTPARPPARAGSRRCNGRWRRCSAAWRDQNPPLWELRQRRMHPTMMAARFRSSS